MSTSDNSQILSTILEQAPTLIIMASREGRIEYSNRQAFGLSRSELLDESIFGFMKEEYVQEFKEIIADVIATQDTKYLVFATEDGTWNRLRIGPVITNNLVSSVVLIANDISDQIKAEEELSKNESMLRSLFNESPEGIMLVDEQGNIIKWNRAQEEIFQISREEVIGRKAWDIQYELMTENRKQGLARESIVQSFMEFLETGAASWLQKVLENHATTKLGEEIIIQQYSAPIKTEKGFLLCSFIHDITERRKAELERERTEKRYSALLDLNNDAVFILDLEGNHLEVNQRAADMLGYSVEELTHLSYKEVIVDREHPESRKRLAEILDTERFDIYERIVKRKDGKEIPVEVNISLVKDRDGNPLHIQSIMRDISERKQVEEEIRQSERKFRGLAERSLQGIQIMQDRHVVYANPRYAEITGRSIEEIYALDSEETWNLIHPDDREEIRERFREYSRSGQLEPSNRYRIIRPNGEVRWVEANIAISEFDGKPAMQRTLIDITEGVQAEDAVKKERDRAEMYLQMAGVIFLVLNDAGDITLINRKGTEVLGYSQEELIGTSWFDYNLQSEREEARKNFQKLIDGGIETLEYVERNLNTKAGESRLIAWHTSVLKNEEGMAIGVISSGEDITEKRAAQQELRKSQEMLSLVMNNIPHYVFWKDTESRYLGCNEVFAINAGFQSPDEIVGLDDFQLPWRATESEGFVEVDKIILDGSISKYEKIEQMRKADGNDAWFRTIKVPLTDPDDKIIGLLGTAEDVTEKITADNELRDSEKKFRTLLQSLDDLVFVFDGEGKYAEYYAKDESDLYVPPSEFLGKHIKEVLPQEVSIPYYEAMERVKSTGKSETFDYPLPDNIKMRWFSASISPHEDGISTVSVIREITARVEAAKELEQAYNIINLSPVVAFLWKEIPERNLETLGRPVEYVTGNAEDLFGYPLSDLRSGAVQYRDLIHPEDIARIREEMRGFRADRLCESYIHEPYRIVTKNGDVRWIGDYTVLRRDDEGTITHTQSVLTDITNRIHIEQALRESESKYRSVIEQSLMGIAVIDEKERMIKFANSMLFQQIKKDADELKRMQLQDLVTLIHPDDLEPTTIFLNRCFEGHDQPSIVVRVFTEGETLAWFEMFGSKIIYDNAPAVQLSVVDITERYRAVETLRRERASFRSIAESAIFASDTEDLANRILEGFIKAMNLEIGTLRLYDPRTAVLKPTASFGVPQDVAEMDIPMETEEANSFIISIVAKSRDRIFSPDITKDLDLDQFSNLRRLGFRSLLVMPLVNKDEKLIGTFSAGSSKPDIISPADSVFFETVAGLLVNILERKQTEQAYRMSLRRYRELLTDLSEGIGIVDLDEKFVFVNDSFSKILGYEKGELLGIDSMMLIHPDDVETIRRETESRRYGISSTYQVRMIRKDGEERIVRISAIPSRDDTGEVEGTVAFISDITERVHAEEEVRKLNQELTRRVKERTAELEAANKELEAFAYSVSHDLRAPLRIIDGFSQAVLEDYSKSLDEVGKDYLNRIRSGAINMADLIEDILGLSRVARTEMERVDVNLSRLAEEVVTELTEMDPERSVELTIEPDIIARCDKRLMRVVLQNLLGNSWKFTSTKKNPQIRFGRKEEGVYFIKDNGVGFNMEYIEKLFKPFQRLHGIDEFEGSGIGLATVMRIINRHGGRIWAEAEQDVGATFYFTLQ